MTQGTNKEEEKEVKKFARAKLMTTSGLETALVMQGLYNPLILEMFPNPLFPNTRGRVLNEKGGM